MLTTPSGGRPTAFAMWTRMRIASIPIENYTVGIHTKRSDTVQTKYHDLFRSNVGKWLKREPHCLQGFMGVVTYDKNTQAIEAICGGLLGYL